MSKTIVFKIWKFPKLSETFVVNQIVIAKKLGYAVKVLVEEVQDIQSNANTSIFDRYEIEKDIIKEDYKIPKKKFLRWVKGGMLFLRNIDKWKQFSKFSKLALKRDTALIYQFDFYRRFKNADVFHIQFGTNKHPVDLFKISGLLKADLVVSFHGHDLFFPINNRIHNDGYYNHLFNASKYLIANTAFLKEKLLQINAPHEKIKVIPVTIDINEFPFPEKKKSAKTIKLVTVGRLDKLKGQRYGIEAVKILLAKGYDVRYILAGAGNEMSALREQVKKLEIEEVVNFKGAINPAEVVSLLQDADIFLMTSVKNAKGEEESQGLVVVEAQASGLPVVAFRSGGVPFTMLENKSGILCEPRNAEGMAASIEKLILDKTYRNEMGACGRKFILENFSEKSVMEKWKFIYA